MPFSQFVHLHVHSEYSLLDGACRLPDLVAQARALHMPALALTDHGALYGAIEFYFSCLQHGLKPILGMEAYVAPGSRLEKKSNHGMQDAAYHLVLLARNLEGYRNLVALSSSGFLQGFYYRPRIDKDVLAKHAGGLIGLSACLRGEIPMLLQKEELPLARQTADEFRQIFGPDGFYLELMDHGLPAQGPVNRGLADLARDLGLPLVATNDVHYLRREDALAQEVLLALQTGATLGSPDRMQLPSPEFYLKSAAEMGALFHEFPQAGWNTLEIANRCNLELPSGRVQLPAFPIPDEVRPRISACRPAGGTDADAYLAHLCAMGLARRCPDANEAVRARLTHELDVIARMGFSDYFLIVWDFIRFAREQSIPVGPGRGSVAGSLAAYVLEITQIDPLRYGLIFERFLNPDRVSLPDIDVDFSDTGREAVIDYVTRTYGQEHVAQIITFGTLAARAAVRDVGRALDYGYEEVDRLAKLIPATPDMTLARALETVPELKEKNAREERVRRLLGIARTLEGQARHASTHAAGVVISREPLLEWVPLCHTKSARGGEGGGAAVERTLTTQYPMESLERLGLLKMDFLGLKTLTLIANTVRTVAERTGRRLDPDALPLDDAPTFALLQEARTDGVFQLESPGMRDLLKRLKPRSLEEICALIALYRPGPMAIIDEYIQRKQGRLPVRTPHPDLVPLLAETYGTIVYQEQVMAIAVRLGGFTYGQADLLRRAMSKKNPEAIEAQRDAFVRGARERGIEEDAADRIFDLMARFGEYGFNKSHSLAYALVAYQCAYLKAHYPLDFAAAALSGEIGRVEKIGIYVTACRRSGVTVLPPDVNTSRATFAVEGDGVRYGLAALRNVGLAAAEAVQAEREANGPFATLEDFFRRVDARVVNSRVAESLIKAGALDTLARSRTDALEAAPGLLSAGLRWQEERERGQTNLFEHLGTTSASSPAPSSMTEPAAVRLAYEKEMMGFYFSGHPLEAYRAIFEDLATHACGQLDELAEGQSVVVGGQVTGLRHQVTKRQEAMLRFTLEDLEGAVEVIVWPELLGRHQTYLIKDAVLLVTAKVDRSGDDAKLVATDVVPVDHAYARLARRLTLTLPSEAGADRLDALQRRLGEIPGSTPVRLRLTLADGREAVQDLPERYQVGVTRESLETLRELLGEERVQVEGPVRRERLG